MNPNSVSFALNLCTFGHPTDTPFSTFIDLAQWAESCGFAGVYTVDHFVLPRNFLSAFTEHHDPERPYCLEAWTTLSAIAASTKNIWLGPQVSPVALRHPVFLAKMAANLDLISEGRLVLQLGAGWHEEEFTAFGFSWDSEFKVRFGKLAEGVEVIKALWETDGLANYEGQYYQLKEAPFWPKPIQSPRPQIWFGGSGKSIRYLVARHGDGWAPAGPHYKGLPPDFYRESLDEIRELATSFGRNPLDIQPSALFCTSIAPTREEAYEMASCFFRMEGWGNSDVGELIAKGCVIAGAPKECIEQLERFVEAGVRHFSFLFIPVSDAGRTRRDLELFSEHVLPHFQNR